VYNAPKGRKCVGHESVQCEKKHSNEESVKCINNAHQGRKCIVYKQYTPWKKVYSVKIIHHIEESV